MILHSKKEKNSSAIGLPISFLTKYCPDQFEIVGATESEGKGFSNGLFTGDCVTQPLVHGRKVYSMFYASGFFRK